MIDSFQFLPTPPDSSLIYAVSYQGVWVVVSVLLALAALGFVALSRANATIEKLRLSDGKLRAIIQAEPECIKIVDAQGNLVEMNPAGLAMIEADSLAQVAGQPVINLIAPEYRAAFRQLHQRVLAGESVELAFEVLGLKGGRRWLETHAVPLQHEGQTVQLAITRNITERKQSEEALRIAATAFESQQGMTITNAQRVILRVNQAFTQITGYSAEEAIGQNPRLLSSGRHDSAFYAAMTQSLESKGAWAGEIWNRRKNGEVYPEWLNISAVKDQAEQTTHFVAIFSDVTEHKSAQTQIDTLAFYDPLTQLPNRRLLLNRLDQALHASTRHALKFRVAGRVPQITVSSSVSNPVTSTSESAGPGKIWQVCITDNGVGITPDQIGRLFQVFQRLHSRAAYEGNGIGLALCRKIAEHHGGRIWAESEGEGRGSRFCVELPTATETPGGSSA